MSAVDGEEYFPGEECGRWRNGSLGDDCLSTGTEYCMFDCPFAGKRIDRALSEAGDMRGKETGNDR
jgi:hypothetical protein